ncbi:hypothetical protein GPECTOR_70g476 [Gonium pectorale]|uniref:YchJ-like middle NTF2-like domain-containing protein n=1 Tax=Gonium pectorale TaxID=33097 RepID=A0A150G2Z4_GONPE|nr:hypothetical protein GPECTOR_70g476 [Gonium pectorale]|eukprot:KXZ44246.1 hypothetical protein GPECTOR_70g476 [Gonium pectorale]
MREWKYITRTTHPDNPNHKGTVSSDGKIRTTFEEDVKVTMYNFEFVKLHVLSAEQGVSPDEAVLEFQLDIKQMLDEKAKRLNKPIPRSIREKALFLRNGDGAWEFRQSLDSNWDRDKLEYKDAALPAARAD